MIIKLTGIEDCLLGTYAAKEIKGVRLDDGSPWSTKFFANDRVVGAALAEFGVGDTIECQMVQKGKHWNIKDIIEVSADKAKSVEGSAPKGYSKPTSSSYQASPNKDGQIARAVALKAAVEMTAGKAKLTPAKVIEIANAFVPFLMDDKPLAKEMKAQTTDPLNPPPVED